MGWKELAGELAGLALPTLVVFAFTAGLWSDSARARKMAVKWGIPEPTRDQIDEVLRYRRLRLACYPPVFVLVAVGIAILMPGGDNENRNSSGNVVLISMFLLGAVIAELLSVARSQRAPLRFADLASRWGVGVFGVLVTATFVVGLIDLQAQPHFTPDLLGSAAQQSKAFPSSPIAIPFAGTVLVVLLVAFVFWSALTRSFSTDSDLDHALRTRSVRVVTGLGVGMQTALLGLSFWRMDFLDSFAIGSDPYGYDPEELALKDWAASVNDTVEPFLSVSSLVAMASWIYIANPPNQWRVLPKKA